MALNSISGIGLQLPGTNQHGAGAGTLFLRRLPTHGFNEPDQFLLLRFVQGQTIAMGQKEGLLLLFVARGVAPGQAHVNLRGDGGTSVGGIGPAPFVTVGERRL